MTISDERRRLIYGWFDTPRDKRTPPTEFEFRQQNNINTRVFRNIKADYTADVALQKRSDIMRNKAIDNINAVIGDAMDDEDKWLAVEKAIYDSAVKRGTVRAQELYAKLKGKLVDKQEIKISIDADEIARRNLIAERELREAGHRVVKVPQKPPLLPE